MKAGSQRQPTSPATAKGFIEKKIPHRLEVPTQLDHNHDGLILHASLVMQAVLFSHTKICLLAMS